MPHITTLEQSNAMPPYVQQCKNHLRQQQGAYFPAWLTFQGWKSPSGIVQLCSQQVSGHPGNPSESYFLWPWQSSPVNKATCSAGVFVFSLSFPMVLSLYTTVIFHESLQLNHFVSLI